MKSKAEVRSAMFRAEKRRWAFDKYKKRQAERNEQALRRKLDARHEDDL